MPAKKDKTEKKSSKKTEKEESVPKRQKAEDPAKPTAHTQYTEKDFPIVGIGASAGGLKVLETFFDNMPPQQNIAFVIIQHLDPKHQSYMSGLLKKHTEMKVSTVKNGEQIEPNHIYVKPPAKDVVINKRTLHLREPTKEKGVQLPIDIFFRSMAKDLSEQAICIVLSGSGSDGTLGLKSIKGEGGMAMAQDKFQAEYAGMPENAIATGLVDYVLPVEKMPSELISYVNHLSVLSENIDTDKEEAEQIVKRILTNVRLATGHDFSDYKRSTINRRIGRRMAVQQIGDLSHYAQYLRQDPAEIGELFNDLLINVTNFFRDSEAFEALEKKAIPALLEQKKNDPDSPIRIWVPGCGTGEEAYSIAMLLIEAMEKNDVRFRIQIFATDLSSKTIEFGRTGLYQDNIAVDVSEERLKRFFKKENNNYRIDRQIREMVVYAVHDLTRDPPFSRLDMISCRNVLIYMNSSLQKKILPLFHYSLQEGGILFLGTSEGVSEYAHLFEKVDKKSKIYRNKKTEDHQGLFDHLVLHAGLPSPEPARHAGARAAREIGERELNIRRLVEQSILKKYSPPGVLVDGKLQILYFHGDTSKFLKPPWGQPSFDVLRMASAELHYKLAKALNRVQNHKKPLTIENLKVRHEHEILTIDVVLTPLRQSGNRSDLILITFEDKSPLEILESEEDDAAEGESADARFIKMRNELEATQQELQAAIEELETSNEELKSANEELQANNEELQSTNEELESAKEELQSTNEELETVNEELERKNLELERAEDDMRNLFHATEIATIYLNEKLRIMRFTPAATRIFNLREQDIGRPVSDITGSFDTRIFAEEAEKVMQSLDRREWDVHSDDDRWFSVRMLPYRTTDNVIAGVVITVIEVTEAKQAEQAAEKARASFQSILDSIPDPLLVLDTEQKVISASRSFYEIFDLKEKDTENMPLYKVGDGEWNIRELRSLLNKVIESGETVKNYKVEAEFSKVGHRTILLDADPIEDERAEMVLVIIKEIKENG